MRSHGRPRPTDHDTWATSAVREKVVHEFEELAALTAYLAFFFCGMATYSMLLLGKFHIAYFAYGTALINAIVIAKVIMIGEAMHAGARFESKALLYSAVWKAFVFAWLVFAFHLLEEMARDLAHRENVAGVFQDIRIDDLLMRAVLVFCTFIPLFILRELRRVMGQDAFRALFFHPTPTPKVPPSSNGI